MSLNLNKSGQVEKRVGPLQHIPVILRNPEEESILSVSKQPQGCLSRAIGLDWESGNVERESYYAMFYWKRRFVVLQIDW